MILAVGLLLWALFLVALARVLWIACAVWLPRSRLGFFLLFVVLLSAGLLLFRPHEDIFGGEDPGSYINAGVTYARQRALFRSDPLLKLVPTADRPVFYYGHAGYGLTKDACLWMVNNDPPIQGPRFQPAYPLLMAVAAWSGAPVWALYVTPLAALLTGVALMALAFMLFQSVWAGRAAFVFFLLNPLTIWHARCARPEISAAFLVFSGAVLLLHARRASLWRGWLDVMLGALCLGMAPFFHITAWLIVIPAACAVGLTMLRGRYDFLIYFPFAWCALWLFYLQSALITDYYRIGWPIGVVLRYWPLAAAMVLLATWIGRRNARKCSAPPTHIGGPWLVGALAFLTILCFFVLGFVREPDGSLPLLAGRWRNFFFFTNWTALLNMVSRPMVVLYLAGWVCWLVRPSGAHRERIVVALVFLPAMLLAGNIGDLMMTRYFMTAIVPVASLCLAGLIACLPALRVAPRWRKFLAPGLIAVLCALGLQQRTHLLALVEHRGFVRFLSVFAQIIQEDRGILLGEYSRIAAPLEHFFGVDTLGLDNERRADYEVAEKAWAQVMRALPERPAFFLTPFQAPRSDLFDFELVREAVFLDAALQQAYHYLPTRIRSGALNLALYRMILKNDACPMEQQPDLCLLPIGPGNMGLRRFANVRWEQPSLDGVWLDQAQTVLLRCPSAPVEKCAPRDLLLVAHVAGGEPELPELDGANGFAGLTNGSVLRLTGDAWLMTLRPPPPDSDINGWRLRARTPFFLAGAFLQTADGCVNLLDDLEIAKTNHVPPAFCARWATSSAACLMPSGQWRHLLALVYAPPFDQSFFGGWEAVGFKAHSSRLLLRPNGWQWALWALPGDAPVCAWWQLHSPPWNPERRGFPDNLGLLFGPLFAVR